MQTARTQARTEAHTGTCKETKTKLYKLHALLWLSIHLLIVLMLSTSLFIRIVYLLIYLCMCIGVSFFPFWLWRFVLVWLCNVFKMWIKRLKLNRPSRKQCLCILSFCTCDLLSSPEWDCFLSVLPWYELRMNSL